MKKYKLAIVILLVNGLLSLFEKSNFSLFTTREVIFIEKVDSSLMKENIFVYNQIVTLAYALYEANPKLYKLGEQIKNKGISFEKESIEKDIWYIDSIVESNLDLILTLDIKPDFRKKYYKDILDEHLTDNLTEEYTYIAHRLTLNNKLIQIRNIFNQVIIHIIPQYSLTVPRKILYNAKDSDTTLFDIVDVRFPYFILGDSEIDWRISNEHNYLYKTIKIPCKDQNLSFIDSVKVTMHNRFDTTLVFQYPVQLPLVERSPSIQH